MGATMREEAQRLVQLIRASIEEAQLRSGGGALSPHGMRNVIALLLAADEELELISSLPRGIGYRANPIGFGVEVAHAHDR